MLEIFFIKNRPTTIRITFGLSKIGTELVLLTLIVH